MRIAVYHNLPSGGAKRTLCESLRKLASQHSVEVFSTTSAEHDFADIRPFVGGHHVYPFTPGPLLNSPFGRLNQGIRLWDLHRLQAVSATIADDITRGGFDILLVHPCRFESCPSIVRLAGLPVVYYCHEPLRTVYETTPQRPYNRPESRWRHALDNVDPLRRFYFSRVRQTDRANIQACTRVLVNSEYMKGVVTAVYGVPAYVSYHGVNSEIFRPQDVNSQGFVLSVGSLTPMKGFDFLIEAIGRVPVAQRPDLVISSNFQNHSEREYLERLARENSVELRLLLNVSDEALVDLYNQAKLVVYAPVREPFGLVPLEAMAAEKAVVAVAEGGIPETVEHERTGLLVPRDLGQFAAAVSRLLENPSLASEYGRRGRDRVIKQWTWETATNTLEDQLRTTLQARLESPVLIAE